MVATTRRGSPTALMTCSHTCVHATSGLSAARLVPSLSRTGGTSPRARRHRYVSVDPTARRWRIGGQAP